jgi:hypothetical protein
MSQVKSFSQEMGQLFPPSELVTAGMRQLSIGVYIPEEEKQDD